MPIDSKSLCRPSRSFLNGLALAFLGMLAITGCNTHENHDDSDPANLPANRYAGMTCEEISNAIADEVRLLDDASQETSMDPAQDEKIPQGPWQATCEVFDYRAIRVDSVQFNCPTKGEDVENCKSEISKIHFLRPEQPGQTLAYSGIYDIQCQFVFSDGTKFNQTGHYGFITKKDCPDWNLGIADDTQGTPPLP